MIRTILHPVFKTAIMPKKDYFQDQMSKLTLLGASKIHILTEEFQTREEMSEIQQALSIFGQSFTIPKTDYKCLECAPQCAPTMLYQSSIGPLSDLYFTT